MMAWLSQPLTSSKFQDLQAPRVSRNRDDTGLGVMGFTCLSATPEIQSQPQ